MGSGYLSTGVEADVEPSTSPLRGSGYTSTGVIAETPSVHHLFDLGRGKIRILYGYTKMPLYFDRNHLLFPTPKVTYGALCGECG